MLVWLGKVFLNQKDTQDINLNQMQQAARGPYQHPFVTEDEAVKSEPASDDEASSLH